MVVVMVRLVTVGLPQCGVVSRNHRESPPPTPHLSQKSPLKFSLLGIIVMIALNVINNSTDLRGELQARSEVMLAVAMKTEQRLPGYFTLHNNMRGRHQTFYITFQRYIIRPSDHHI